MLVFLVLIVFLIAIFLILSTRCINEKYRDSFSETELLRSRVWEEILDLDEKKKNQHQKRPKR